MATSRIVRLVPVPRAAADQCDVVLVDDGSRDGTWGVIEHQRQQHAWVRGIDLLRNFFGAQLATVGIMGEYRAEQGLFRVTVVTRCRNRSAMARYQAAGYSVSDIQVWIHRWLQLQ